MKIAMILEHMDPARGGREVYVAQVAPLLAKRGHEVSVVCQDAAWSAPLVKIVAVGVKGASKLQRLENFVADVRAHVSSCDYDISHVTLPIPGCTVYQPHGGTAPAIRACSLRRRSGLARLAAIATYPFNSTRRRLAQLEEQVVANPRTTCLAVSQMVARQFAEYYGRTGNVHVVFNGASAPAIDETQRGLLRKQMRQQIGASLQDTVFLSVARNFELKGMAEAIRAFARWRAQSPARQTGRLVLLGQDDVARYRRLADGLGAGDRVHFVAYTSDLAGWYSAADAVMLLSWYDSCSLVVLEAVRWLLPALTTSYNGAAEVLSGGAGIIVDAPDNTSAVVAAMNTLARPYEREPMRQACQKLSPWLSMDRHVDDLLKAYDQARAASASEGGPR